jgi:signal transduction histidine kinase
MELSQRRHKGRVAVQGLDAGPLSRVVLGGAIVLAALAVVLTAVVLYYERERAFAESAADATRLAQILEEQTLRTVQAVDLTLRNVVASVAFTPDLTVHDPRFEAALRRRRDELPFVRTLFVVGADGFISQDSDPDTPRVPLTDRPYFSAHRDQPALGLHISRPLVSRSVNRPFVSMSRRINAPDGGFGGVVIAAVEPRYFGALYEKLNMARADSISIFHRDGTLLWRTPYVEDAIGASYAHLPLFQREVVAQPSNVYRTTSLVDAAPLIVAYRAIEGLPLVVAVGIDERAMLTGWRRTAAGATIALALLLGLLATLAILGVRYLRREAAIHERLLHAQQLEALGRMTAGMAHDFGNVLGVIRTNLTVLRRSLDELPEPVERAINATNHGTALAARLLAFARSQSLTIDSCAVNDVLATLLPLLEDAAGPSVSIHTALASDLWRCRTDHAQLSSAILNLVLNARDSMAGETGTIRITTDNVSIGSRRAYPGLLPGDYVRVTVSDDGPGMSPETLRRATEPFFSTKGSRIGTGLGLSQIYGFAQQVGGALQIQSRAGAGTSVQLLFPRDLGPREPDSPQAARLDASLEPARPAPSTP